MCIIFIKTYNEMFYNKFKNIMIEIYPKTIIIDNHLTLLKNINNFKHPILFYDKKYPQEHLKSLGDVSFVSSDFRKYFSIYELKNCDNKNDIVLNDKFMRMKIPDYSTSNLIIPINHISDFQLKNEINQTLKYLNIPDI